MTVLAGYHHAAVALRKARSVVVCGHIRPDGDALGSALGLTLALRDVGIPAVPTLANAGVPAPSTYAFLPGVALFVGPDQLDSPDVFVALDTPTLERLGDATMLAESATTLIVLDHHPDAQEYGDINVLDSTAPATGAMVWSLLDPLDVTPSAEVALACYVALMTDTGRFQYANTTARALRDAASMVDAGADPAEASRLVYHSRTRESLALEAIAVSRIEVVNGGRVAVSVVRDTDFAATGARPEDAEFLIDAVREVGDVDAVAVARVRGDEVRVSLRAKTGADVAAVARAFGGGGHTAAAGFTFVGTYDELLPQLLAALPGGA